MPNLVAYLALILWIPLTVAMCAVFRPSKAAIWMSLAGWMFLPEKVSFDPPGLPPVDKYMLTPTLLLACFLVLRPNRVLRARFGRGPEFFALVLMLADFGTTLTNPDALFYGKTFMPGMTLHNTVSLICSDIFTVLIPFFVGRVAVQTSRELRLLLASIAIAGLIYTPFMFVELRMSPQFHRWVYGYGAHEDFLQSIRGGGYRPSVFMSHGLTVAMFTANAVLSAAGTARAKLRIVSYSAGRIAAYLAIALVTCKSMASMLYAGGFSLLLTVLRPKRLLQVCCLLSVLVAAYPIARANGIFPREAIVGLSGSVSQDRAASLDFRFENEEALLAKAAQRPWFGWGQYGRNRIFDKNGKDISVTDGGWIIMLGGRGIIGLVCYFLLLLGPVWSAAFHLRRIQDKTDRILVGALACLVTIASIDVLPNALATSCQLFFAGALLGVSRMLPRARPALEPPLAQAPTEARAQLTANS